MTEKTTIARPYAAAVFELALASGRLHEWSGTLDLLSQVVNDARIQALLDNPALDTAAAAKLIIDVCGDHLDDQGRNLVRTLADADRLAFTPWIYRLFEQERLASEGRVEVDVLSAYPLETQEQDRIGGLLAARFGRKVSITARVDETLIGGVVVRAGDTVIDASVRGKLKQLGNELRN